MTNLPPPESCQGRFFMIHAMPRSASRSMRLWLDRQDGVICHGEILGANNVLATSDKQKTKFTLRQRNNKPYEFAGRYFDDHKNDLAGFKALTSHLVDERNFAFLRWFIETQPKVISLHRRDLVARFKSMVFHRLSSNAMKPEQAAKLKSSNIALDCIRLTEAWNMAGGYWLKDLSVLRLETSELGEGLRDRIDGFLEVTLSSEQGRENSNSRAKVEKKFPKIIAHLDDICADRSLDPYRDCKF